MLPAHRRVICDVVANFRLAGLEDIYPKAAAGEDGVARPTECTIRTGELLYLPEGWYHSTYNLAPTIGVARQYMPDVHRRTMEDSPMWWRQVTSSKSDANEDQPEDRPDTLEGGLTTRGVPDSFAMIV